MSGPRNRRARVNRIAAGALSALVGVTAFSTVGAGAHPADPRTRTLGPGEHSDTTVYGDNADRDRTTGVYQLTDAEIEALRTVTAPFANPEAAVATGRVDLELCVDQMGDHFADPATFGDGILDPADPEALVYADVDGTRTLVAVEWVATSPGEVLGTPLHLNHDLDVWVLHAWIGLENPSGMHADHNPNLGDCPA